MWGVLRLSFLVLIGRVPITLRHWKTDSPSCWSATIPGTGCMGYGHNAEMAVGNLILSNQSRLGFVLKHREQA